MRLVLDNKITAYARVLMISSMLVLTQVVVSFNAQPAYADSHWDGHGKVLPHHKITTVRMLAHGKIKHQQKSIPIFRMHGKHLKKVENYSQVLATIVTTGPKTETSGMFEGLYYDNVTPPDVQVAAGPNNVMEMVNLEGQIWDKNGNVQEGPFDLATFFGTGSDMVSDPKVIYDSQSGRWFTSITDISSSNVIVAVSSTSDATGGYCIYNIPGPSFSILDQPIIGTSNDKFVVSVNDFSSITQQFGGAQFWVLNKSDMLNCAGANYVTKTFNNYFSIHPVQSITGTETQYMVSASQNNAESYISLFSVNGVPPNPVSFLINNLQVSSISTPPSAVQEGSLFQLDTGDYRIQDAQWDNGILWLAHNNSCIPRGDTAARSCLHLVQINTGTMSVLQDFNIGVAGKYLFYPAIRETSAGNLVMVYGLSSASDYPSIDVTEQTATEPANSIMPPTTLQQGNGPVSIFFGCLGSAACRYGDYFGAGVDPSDPQKVWVAGEYGSGNLDFTGLGETWATKIGSITG